jgi:hypothetical protein
MTVGYVKDFKFSPPKNPPPASAGALKKQHTSAGKIPHVLSASKGGRAKMGKGC